MRNYYLKQFICKIQPKNILIPAQVYFDEAYYQRDMYRNKLRAYRENQSDKKLRPSGLPQDYILPIMQNLERRSERPLQKRPNGSYLYPQPAYLVLAAWSFILFTDAHFDKFFEGNFRVEIKNYLDRCTSFPGLRDALNQAIQEYENAVNPSLFDVPPVAPKAPQSPLPEYGRQSPLPEYGHQTIPLDARKANINIDAPNSTFIFQCSPENVRIHQQPKQPKQPKRATSAQTAATEARYSFVVQQEKAEEVIERIRHYAEGKEGNPKLMMMPVRAAQEAGAIDGVTHAKLAEILPQYGSMNKSTFNRWIKQYEVGTHPYAGHSAFQNMVADFRKLMEE